MLSNTFVSVVLLGYLVVRWVALVVWTLLDIFSRTKSWFIRFGAVILVGIGSIFGFILYLIVRPQTTIDDQEIRNLEEKILESQSKVFSCPKCSEILREDFLFCTNCGTAVKRECPGCHRALEIAWAQCPFCSSFVGQPVLPQVKETIIGGKKISLLGLLSKAFASPQEPTEVKKGRGRPRKNPLPNLPTVKRPVGRPKKNVS